MCDNCRSAM
jgi:hypothetical protein